MLTLASPQNNIEINGVLSTIWSPEHYRSLSRAWRVGTMTPEKVTPDGINLLDMPVKLPGEELRLPELPTWLRTLVEELTAWESRLHPRSAEMYAYLTVNQGVVVAGKSQRNGGAHFDGMQGRRYPEKLPPCHQYLYATAAPTLIYEHPFELSALDPARDNFFTVCDRQKREAWQAQPGEIVLTTAYTVHESPVLSEDTERTFVRLEFSHKRADREGNTLNPVLDTSDWDYGPRPIPSDLR